MSSGALEMYNMATMDNILGSRSRSLQDSDSVIESIDQFLRNAENQLRELLWAINGEETEQIHMLAGSLRSSSLQFDAKDFTGLCHELEILSAEKQLQGANTLFQELQMRFHLTRISLENVRDSAMEKRP
jgi:HPt (histidine-containing phosphotransfer) domain-containing protein